MKSYDIEIKGNDGWYILYHQSYKDFEEAYRNAVIACAQYQKTTIEWLRIISIVEV